MLKGRSYPRSAVYLFLRRLAQFVSLTAVVFLFLHTDYSGADSLEYAVNILFRLDPYLAAVTMLAAGAIISLMLPALVVLLLSLFAGRSFCGWLCPMGSCLDGFRHLVRSDRCGRKTLFPSLALWLLVATIALAVLGFHVAGFLDPFSLLVRGLAQAFYPAFHGAVESFFTFTYREAPDWVNVITEPIYGLLREYILPAERKYFQLAWLSGSMFLALLLLEQAQKRFYCRNVCPLGAMLGVVSSFGLMKGHGGNDDCGSCQICSGLCRMGAIGKDRTIDMGRCNLCMECVSKCPRGIIGFGYSGGVSRPSVNGLTRRQFMGAVATGVILPAVKQVQGLGLRDDPGLIRPPGALPEAEFSGRCVRCAECIQVCIGNGLQPALFEGGFDGVFSPRLSARSGYCEFNCTLCGQVCPTGAITVLTKEEKHGWKIGHAWFDTNTCLPYAKGIQCMVCEEHCPTPVKAIQFREAEVVNVSGERVAVKQPYIVDEHCIGCGICEFKCPLPGKAAIHVTSAGEQRNPWNFLPTPSDSHYG